jgi:hypothetical protein
MIVVFAHRFNDDGAEAVQDSGGRQYEDVGDDGDDNKKE